MTEQKNERIFQEADSEIKKAWGEEYRENYNVLDYTLDNVFSKEDSAKIKEAFPNDIELADSLVFVAKKFGAKFGWLDKAKIYQKRENE